ncbi:uncharacterized protein LOC133287487 [Gastrolobium bilobum]|uniref:uncharacterized protein LOC133287487 n=1 Tax=Gastrolobium bilobum TaxID=150636 RepID=UPI002AB28E59|nr:uncharacterized protein LOC133287487 [Gastrolobium bilobum]
MASSADHKFSTIFLLLCLAFLFISTSEVQLAEAKTCQRRSNTFSGPCSKDGSCKNQCIHVERAKNGACHRDGTSSVYVQLAEAQGCQMKSKTLSGPCLNTNSCKNQCINVEHANFGACHRDGFFLLLLLSIEFVVKQCPPLIFPIKLWEKIVSFFLSPIASLG